MGSLLLRRRAREARPAGAAGRRCRPAVVLLVLALVGSSVVVLGGPAAAWSGTGPADLQANAGDGELRLTWLAPSAAVTGYDVQYKTRDAPGREAGTPGDPSTGWVDAGHSGTETSHTISGLQNSLRYFIRVRAVDASGNGAWSTTGGAPTAPPDPKRFCQPIPECPRPIVVVPPVLWLYEHNHSDLDEGRAVDVTVTFKRPLSAFDPDKYAEEYPSEEVNEVRFSYLPVDTVVKVEVDTSHRHHTATEGEDFTLSTKRLTIGAYEKNASFQVRAHADRKNEGAEWIVLKLTPVSNAPYEMPEPIGVILKIWDFSREPQLYLLGPDSVSEGGKSVRVSVVLHYRAPEGGATVKLSVGAGSTATEGDDFTMPATVTVPEGRDWVTTAVAIVDDDTHEGLETIEVNAVNTATGIKGSRRITIRDNDPAPPPEPEQQVETSPQPGSDGAGDAKDAESEPDPVPQPEPEAVPPPEPEQQVETSPQLGSDGAGDAESAESEPEAAPPGPVQNLRLVSKGEGTRLRVEWDAPTSGGKVTRYEVTLQDSDGGKANVRRPGSKKHYVVFRNVRSGATYQVSVLAKSGDAKGEAVTAQLTLD